jgi:hypothetical protein
MLADDDLVVDCQTGQLGQFGVRRDADTHHDRRGARLSAALSRTTHAAWPAPRLTGPVLPLLSAGY